MWLLVFGVPFFFLGMAVRSWRAPLYALGVCLVLLILWLFLAVEGATNDSVWFAIVIVVSMLASYLGAIAGVLLAPKPGNGEAPQQGERDIA
jgi:hypothetical protein